MMPLLWKWLGKNVNLMFLLTATVCLVFGLGEVLHGVTRLYLMPVSLVAVSCSWVLSASKLKPSQAGVRLVALGILVVLTSAGGLIRPLVRLVLAGFSFISSAILWVFERVHINISPLLAAWAELMGQIAGLFTRLWEWGSAFFSGNPMIDPLVAGVMWSMLMWLVGIWAGWQLGRHQRALKALAPGLIVLALALDYSRSDGGILILYLAVLLVLTGFTKVERMHQFWRQRGVEYAESVRVDTLAMVGVVTTALVLSAAGTPSLSWREFVEERRDENRVAESLELERMPNIAGLEVYRSNGLPRSHLLGSSPDLLQDVVMTVSTGELSPVPEAAPGINPNRYYWRAITYDVYSGAGWSSSPAQEISLSPDAPLFESPPGYRAVTQNVKKTDRLGRTLYWTGVLSQSNTEIEIAWRSNPLESQIKNKFGDMLGALTNSDEYILLSYVPQFTESQLRASGSDYPQEITRRYLQLPDSIPGRVLSTAHEITETAATPYDRALAIEAYLRTFPYTLDVDPPPPDRDVVDYFLFTAQEGYCDYYATSMAVLARAAGLPARIVIGYANGDYDASTARYIVRQIDAHSWVEVYFADLGWVEFEPTASQPVIVRRENGGDSEISPDLRGASPAFFRLKNQWRNMISSLRGQLLVAAISFMLLVVFWQVGEIGYLYLISSQQALSRVYSGLEKASVGLLPDLPVGHTPLKLVSELAFKLSTEKNQLLTKIYSPAKGELENIALLYTAQVFSAHPPTKRQIRTGVRAWMRLRWRLWLANRLNR